MDRAPTWGIAISALKAEGKCPEKTERSAVKNWSRSVVEVIVHAYPKLGKDDSWLEGILLR